MIVLQNVRAGYREDAVIRVDRLRMEPGTVTVIIGKNGCGKSTLLRTIDGQLPYEGSILVDGREVSALSQRERACRMAYLPQTLLPVPMTVRTLVGHGRFSRMRFSHTQTPEDQALVREAIGRTGLQEIQGRSVDSLSGGERSLAYFAMVMAQQAPVLLLDEPMANLDQPHVRLLTRLIRELADEGNTVVMTCHDLPLGFTVGDRLCLMQGGEIAAEGSPEELTEQPKLLWEALGTYIVRTKKDTLLYPYALGRTEEI